MLDKKTLMKLYFNKLFNTHAIQDGTPPFEHYIEAFEKADYGLAIRIEEGLAAQTTNIELFIITIAGIITLLIIILGAAILWNQRKIKKMLRQIQEQNAAASKNEAQEE